MTIDIGFASLTLEEFELGIVDVPGHERFIRNMLAGATGNDLVMLVVAADDSVMPQTREHLEILKRLDVHRGLVVITKCDLIEPDLVELIEEEIRELVADTFLATAPIVQTSAVTGQGIAQLRSTLLAVCREIHPRPVEKVFRLAVDRSFVVQGQGTVVTGSVASGVIRPGEQIEWMPAGKPVRIRSLESHGCSVDHLERGQRGAIGLVGVHHRQVDRGDELATMGFLQPTSLMTVQFEVSAGSPWPVKHRARVRLHIGTAERMAVFSMLKGNVMNQGESGIAQLFLSEQATATCGQSFVLRSISPLATLGGGSVLQPGARRVSRRQAGRLSDILWFESPRVKERIAAAVLWYGIDAWDDLDLCRDACVELEDVAGLRGELETRGTLVSLVIGPNRTLCVHRETLNYWNGRILLALQTFHDQEKLQVAMPRRVLADRVGLADDDMLLACFVDRLAESGDVTARGDAVHLAGFSPRLSADQQDSYDRLIELYRAARFQPPMPKEAASSMKIAESMLQPILQLAAARQILRHLGSGLYLHADFESQLRSMVSQKLAVSNGLTVSEIKTILGTSRKFALPFCEYLDRIGVTRRHGDLRILAIGHPPSAQPCGTA